MTTPLAASEAIVFDESSDSATTSRSTSIDNSAHPAVESSLRQKPRRKASIVGYGPWTPEEHERFLLGIQLHPEGPWKAVADVVQTRSAKQAQTHMQKCKEKILRHHRRRDEALRDVIEETADDVIRLTAATAAAAVPPIVLQRSKHADNLRLRVLEPIPFETPLEMVQSALPGKPRSISWPDAVDYFWSLVTASELQ
ncbi:hypothetical protein SPRG_14499 [Saprolegnia parasitica CBS 223.65]|uniref:Uncharacterized protein n=1 Tax=Saprolegnia parasitica (strain CBS 223.65) TaxID=695850 RepID=A0A067BPT1_SAPPC|nr:hypothetical protein SPRG_14499 [Saprolegnia parasitica CBS 223.65]KDO20253.1 hypothetical protein SPRG_14499 [Saprolegnia parasitica CBS 223.65]|eukprot:XP_012209065.1 hypothetical protein SPRG_14499 [Saprolegnia parasitica CBS 223.65]